MGFSGRTCLSMLVFVRGSQIPGLDGRSREDGGEKLWQGNAQKPGTLSLQAEWCRHERCKTAQQHFPPRSLSEPEASKFLFHPAGM